MNQFKRLSHAIWQCKYHVVWCPKYRFRILRDEIGRSVRDIIRQLCEWRKIEILEGNVQIDHLHLVLSIPPKYSVSEAIGFIKGKSAIRIHRKILGTKRMTGLSFWATGYCVRSVDIEEETVNKKGQGRVSTGFAGFKYNYLRNSSGNVS